MSGYILTARARNDILRIWGHIAQDNIDAADKVKLKLQTAMQQLARVPGMGHRRADVKNLRYRFWSVYSYLIAYYPGTAPLQAVRVIHGARNIATIFRK